jgi:hypothetical protein
MIVIRDRVVHFFIIGSVLGLVFVLASCIEKLNINTSTTFTVPNGIEVKSYNENGISIEQTGNTVTLSCSEPRSSIVLPAGMSLSDIFPSEWTNQTDTTELTNTPSQKIWGARYYLFGPGVWPAESTMDGNVTGPSSQVMVGLTARNNNPEIYFYCRK